jgi:chromosome segregation ATPase
MDTETRNVLERIILGMDAGFAKVDQRFDALQTEMRDGFRSVDERLCSLERDVNALWTESRRHTTEIAGLSGQIAVLTQRVGKLEKRLDTMSDDMRQRFRTVIERIAALEHA